MPAISSEFNQYLLWFKTRVRWYGVHNFCSKYRLKEEWKRHLNDEVKLLYFTRGFLDPPFFFVLLQKFLAIYPRNGAALMLVSLCAVLHPFSLVLLKKSGHRILGDNAIIQSSISTAIVSISKNHLHHLPLNVINQPRSKTCSIEMYIHNNIHKDKYVCLYVLRP